MLERRFVFLVGCGVVVGQSVWSRVVTWSGQGNVFVFVICANKIIFIPATPGTQPATTSWLTNIKFFTFNHICKIGRT